VEAWDSLSHGPSTTDLVTNIVRLRPLSLKRHLAGIIRGELAEELLPAILHEGTHHWCFLTPLGQALALQRLRARTLLLSDSSDQSEALDAILRSGAIESALRPLAEGLSLLAELHGIIDYTRRSHTSRFHWWTLWIGFRHVADPDKPQVFSTAFLRQARSEHGLRRRCEVLSNPFDCRLGGYLPGYMALRKLWQATASTQEDVESVGNFVANIRTAVYYDPVLMELAIRQPVDDPHKIAALVFKRLDEILTPNNLAEIETHRLFMWIEGELYTCKDLALAVKSLESIDGDPPRSIIYGDELTAAMLALGELHSRVTSLRPSPPRQGWVENHVLLRQRDLFWLASEKRVIRRAGNYFQIEGDQGWMAIGAVERDYPTGSKFEGRVDLAFDLAGTWLVVMVSVGDQMLSSTSVIGNSYSELLFLMNDIDETEKREVRLDKEALARLSPSFISQLRSVQDATFSDADHWYASAASDDPSSCLNELRLEGWAGVLKGDSLAVRALALLSSDVTYGPYEAGTDTLVRDNNISRGTLTSMQQALKKVGAGYLIAPPWN
jgi:hypothetical protein